MVESNASCARRCSRHAVCNGVPNTSTDKTYASVKRRRHKTVHFGDNLLLQVCANANMTSQNMAAHKLEPNVQQLFSFIEAVLSAWVTEEGLTSQGEVTVIREDWSLLTYLWLLTCLSQGKKIWEF